MAGPLRTKKLMAEDFVEQKDWIAKLLQPFNQLLESLTSALNKQLTFNDNFDAMVTDVVVTEGFTDPVFLTVNTKTVPRGVIISRAINVDDGDFGVSGALGLSWEYVHTTNQIKITSVYGLDTSKKYRLTLFIHTT